MPSLSRSELGNPRPLLKIGSDTRFLPEQIDRKIDNRYERKIDRRQMR